MSTIFAAQGLAARTTAEQAGYVTGKLLLYAVGITLLVIGIRRYRQHRHLQKLADAYAAQTGTIPATLPSKKNGAVMITIGVLLIVGNLAANATTLAKQKSVSTTINVGECITDADYQAAKVNALPSDCTRDDAIYELASREPAGATCPDNKRSDSDYSILANDSTTLCFTANFHTGSCYRAEGQSLIATPCTGRASIRITARHDGITDPAVCGPESTPRVILQPRRTYCIQPL